MILYTGRRQKESLQPSQIRYLLASGFSCLDHLCDLKSGFGLLDMSWQETV